MSKEAVILKPKNCVLKVSIHRCEECEREVKKLLQKIEGVYWIKIDAELVQVIVERNVDPNTLLEKLQKNGKHAELWPSKDGKPQKGGKDLKGKQQQQQLPQKIEDNEKRKEREKRAEREERSGDIHQTSRTLFFLFIFQSESNVLGWILIESMNVWRTGSRACNFW